MEEETKDETNTDAAEDDEEEKKEETDGTFSELMRRHEDFSKFFRRYKVPVTRMEMEKFTRKIG